MERIAVPGIPSTAGLLRISDHLPDYDREAKWYPVPDHNALVVSKPVRSRGGKKELVFLAPSS
ncbi:hypothetical protein ZHAS_00007979 [Anopheles sinensis]|uniref:Uncharacterized protein n=1 Tax=Anopheles sinensis TaxID=74873 RepID=A0A084VR97_ANOSI|nr:hypothetical protein ZHAS_00007979 [Anopheles sinensis]